MHTNRIEEAAITSDETSFFNAAPTPIDLFPDVFFMNRELLPLPRRIGGLICLPRFAAGVEIAVSLEH
jgi:hypothetical protein